MAPEKLQELDLTKRTLAQDLFGEDVGDFLDGNVVAVALRRAELGQTDYAVSTMTYFLDDLESLVNNKVLAVDLVDLSTTVGHCELGWWLQVED